MPLILIGVIGGTLLATALKGLFDTGSTLFQNKYNSPVAMLRRVRRAGLPMSYMYQGKVAQQTQSPQLSIDSHFGTLARDQSEKLKSDTAGRDIQNKVDQGNLDWLNQESSEPGKTNQQYNLDSEQAKLNAEAFIKKHEEEIKQIEVWVENNAFAKGIQFDLKQKNLEIAGQKLKNLLLQAGLMNQLKQIRAFDAKLNSELTKDLDSMPEWISSALKLLLIATKRR